MLRKLIIFQPLISRPPISEGGENPNLLAHPPSLPTQIPNPPTAPLYKRRSWRLLIKTEEGGGGGGVVVWVGVRTGVCGRGWGGEGLVGFGSLGMGRGGG